MKKACNFIKKETPAQVFSSELCKILTTPFSQNTYGQLFFKIEITLPGIDSWVQSRSTKGLI